MISSEATEQEQAKMRIAEKRREMKEKKEREAELERQKQVIFSLIEKKGRLRINREIMQNLDQRNMVQ